MNLRKLLTLVFAVCCCLAAHAQSPFYHFFQDTILPGFRISGTLDSTDQYCSPYASNTVQFVQPSLRTFSFRQVSKLPAVNVPRRYSNIPHIGFSYSMGSNLQQLGKISYTQATDSINFLQMDYQRQLSNGAMRNQDLVSNQMELSWLRRGKFYGLGLDIKYLSLEQGLNGGLLGDTIQNDFGQEFQEVNKGNARQKYNLADLRMENFFSLTDNPDLKTGFFVSPFFKVTNRRYSEVDSLPEIYGFTNYDTLTTQDFWQRGEIGASAGYFFHTKPFVLNGGIELNYWDFDNYLVHNDTLELAAVGDLIVDLRSGWQWKNAAKINVLGALGEFGATTHLYKAFQGVTVSLDGNFGRRYPQPYQRNYFGNTVNYSWNTKTLETYVNASGLIKIRLRGQTIRLYGGADQRFNMPVFLDGRWRQDTLTSLSLAHVGGGFDLSWKRLLFQPKATFQISSISIVPALIVQARIAYNGTLFKAGRLRTVTGIDLGYTTAYTLMGYSPMMDTYVFSSSARTFEAMPKIHFFTQFDLGFLRWFIRVENIEQTFVKTRNYEAVGYSVLPMQVRFGVSWDLFN